MMAIPKSHRPGTAGAVTPAQDGFPQGESLGTIGQRIRACRKREALSQGQLADRLGVTQPTVANWEASVHDPRQPMLAKLAETLGVSLGWLAGGGGLASEAGGGAAAPYVRRPIQHVPVLPVSALLDALRAGDLHEGATDYVPIAYGGGRLAAVFLPDGMTPQSIGAGALFIVDCERRAPVPGEIALIDTAAGPLARAWPEGGRPGEVLGTVVATMRFH